MRENRNAIFLVLSLTASMALLLMPCGIKHDIFFNLPFAPDAHYSFGTDPNAETLTLLREIDPGKPISFIHIFPLLFPVLMFWLNMVSDKMRDGFFVLVLEIFCLANAGVIVLTWFVFELETIFSDVDWYWSKHLLHAGEIGMGILAVKILLDSRAKEAFSAQT